MDLNPNYLQTGTVAPQDALFLNVHASVMKTYEFNTFVDNIDVKDSDHQVVIAMSLVDISFQKMSEHNVTNYDKLMEKALSSLILLNCEITKLVSYLTNGGDGDNIINKIFIETHIRKGNHPVKIFCDERDSKDLVDRTDQFIESIYRSVKFAHRN